MGEFDAAVVGAGPNGLAAAVELGRNGRKVVVYERSGRVGGGAMTEELTLPGFRHDVCSAIHPAGIASPFFNDIGLDVDWIHPPIPFAHPLGQGRAVALHRSVDETADHLGDDASTYRTLMSPLVANVEELLEDTLSPMTLMPRHLASFTRVSAIGALPASVLAGRFDSVEGRALLAGVSAHAVAPFSKPATSAVGLMLAVIGHSHGWPMARGGSSSIADALARRVESAGGEIRTGVEVGSLEHLPGGLTMLDVMPPAAVRLAGRRISTLTRSRLRRWRPGPGVFKVDWALDGPIPWSDSLSRQAGTVHVGGAYEEIEAAEATVFDGKHPDRPFVLLAQQTLFDPSRAPEGKHTAWGYCHVPNGSQVDMTEAIENQVERFAPGFKDLILKRATRNSIEYEAHNPNLIGGDIGGGGFGLKKILQLGSERPYRLGDGLFLCSSAVPPGAGVHGMCGYNAVQAALS